MGILNIAQALGPDACGRLCACRLRLVRLGRAGPGQARAPWSGMLRPRLIHQTGMLSLGEGEGESTEYSGSSANPTVLL